MSVGGELETLRDLHSTFVAKADDADGIKTAVTNSLDSAVWDGANATKFREAWDDYKKNLDTLRDALEDAAEDVKINHNNLAQATGEDDRI
ncbi:WXG100 family type VII secretion target [Phytoactinopolyspora mesophila]|uniref:WXG100 family type VII secretion target n=1 Tax=Phytoactinopolyspora mesophila TaxID=2650750 RepID=A0A7K3M6I3_9ACTN|nr:WXG100 family type VII secretion target [Phytoactinopolyspora mesophila]NDL58921.1 hypothetical protein [Phytoactinopolyspora mesophila]